jgi:hypothetical protein
MIETLKNKAKMIEVIKNHEHVFWHILQARKCQGQRRIKMQEMEITIYLNKPSCKLWNIDPKVLIP